MKIPVILGTAREGRFSEKVARYIETRVKEAGHDTYIADVRDFRLPASDRTKSTKEAKRFLEIVGSSDALIIVSPEYNHSFPGELKMMIDMVYRDFQDKPIGIVGVSSGSLGGARMAEQLRTVITGMGAIPIRYVLYFRNVRDSIDEDGMPKEDSYMGDFETFIGELERVAEKMKG